MTRKLAIEQTTNKDRIFSIPDFVWLWFGMTAQMGVFNLGASFAFKIPFYEVMAAVLLGNFIVSIVLVLNGDPGSKYGIKFAVFLRAAFGYLGGKIALVRAIGATCWFGIQTYFGAVAINLAVKYVFEYDNWPLFFILFGIAQILLCLMGIKWIKWLQNLAAPALFLLSLWIIYFLVSGSEGGWSEFANADIRTPLPFWAALTANLSYWVTVAINISDFTRHIKNDCRKSFFSRNKVSIIGQLPAVTVGMVVFVTVGMVGAVFTGNGNPVEIINSSLGGAWVLLGLFIILLAQLSTNVPANLFATANVISGCFARQGVTYKHGVLIAGVIGMLTMPWYLVEHFLVYLPFIGALLAPLPGIMMTDYFLIRKARLSVKDLFDWDGKYSYWKGINPAAIIAYVAGLVAGLSYLRLSWLIALPVALIIYYVLMKVWIQKSWPRSVTETDEEAVCMVVEEDATGDSISSKL